MSNRRRPKHTFLVRYTGNRLLDCSCQASIDPLHGPDFLLACHYGGRFWFCARSCWVKSGMDQGRGHYGCFQCCATAFSSRVWSLIYCSLLSFFSRRSFNVVLRLRKTRTRFHDAPKLREIRGSRGVFSTRVDIQCLQLWGLSLNDIKHKG